MASVAQKLTVAEFEKQYGREKPYYEYWYGEPVQKSRPNWLYGLLQKILMDLLSVAGYKSASEVTLKIDPEFYPIPDIIATRGRIELPYPTKPLEIVIEILSPDDSMSRILTKCNAYRSWGFEQVYVVDPENRAVFAWTDRRLEAVETLALIPVEQICTALDRALQ